MIIKIKDKTPIVDNSAFVVQNAVVAGDVALGKKVSVWFNAVLRGDMDIIRVGDYSNIQDGCILHTDEGFPLKIGESVVVGHGAVLHGCEIKDSALIGIGATVLNGAVVGKNSIVGAGALVTEGCKIPDGHLAIGIPAKVVRKVTESEIARINEGAKHYVELIKLYND
ncbi:MAG: gamma carbonic anhydrase family protein [Deltaproteobacteria bacterium]|nr:gamma carbonic anhydrase family protein [Deltaproteobacteria bacterium]